MPVRALPGYTHGGFASETRPLNGLGSDFDLVKKATTQIVGSRNGLGPSRMCDPNLARRSAPMVAPASSDSILIMLNSLTSARLESVGAPERHHIIKR